MNKGNANAANMEGFPVRVTRARAKASATGRPSFKQDQNCIPKANTKRAANKASLTAAATFQHKRRAVLQDVTNISSKDTNVNCVNANKVQNNKKAGICTVQEAAEELAMENPLLEVGAKESLAEELSKIKMVDTRDDQISSIKPEVFKESIPDHVKAEADLEEETKISTNLETSNVVSVVDIDSKFKDRPLYCSLYAPDIYQYTRIAELDHRPSVDYMERLQNDITPAMRGILVDWLVEVSEEYRLSPDTLYLTVQLIDRFLSNNYIEKQRLQLLGVTCMLIASKYVEICAPQVEEFCLITDSTYTRTEVLKMESQVLNFLCFRLSVPTTKRFLRRYIQAAQASSKAPCIELELLANYLAELTLVEYDFLKFLPSFIAASAVFLARWILDQSDHPWNATLEHYTNYKASELETTVLALEDLHLNINGGSLTAIYDKYGQHKFKRVATLKSSRRVLTLFKQ